MKCEYGHVWVFLGAVTPGEHPQPSAPMGFREIDKLKYNYHCHQCGKKMALLIRFSTNYEHATTGAAK